jgi:hypothetical protein
MDKKQASYDDLIDAIRLSLKGYNIKLKNNRVWKFILIYHSTTSKSIV